ncbi:LysR substrate-binding domain-containing protein [Ralstonia sp. GX3-BWBA]|jgi:DNA-binding transcriptional LysR family regulator|uniref:LysR substrate-binding domain-containing protein n=1 Tax=Ralstonia sp. GX3-BWBA TaxID=2219865 RepID=UPI000DD2F2BD|nr:LysR substrate-binding domain-containing protein [Ralstonia sp. GX3-BWBA]
MDLKQLRYFITVAEQLHFGNAAELLDIAPSALSMQIQALERELGVKLLTRTKRSVSLNTAGVLFLKEAQQTLATAENAKRVAMMAGRGQVGALEVGYVISAACAGVVQQLLAKHGEKFPQVHTNLHSLESPTQIQLLQQRVLDACIVRTAAGHRDEVEQIRMLREKLVVALPKTHRLAAAAAVHAKDLANEVFTAPQFHKDIGFARHVIAIGKGAGFTPNIEFQTKDFLTALVHVASGHGIAVIPKSISSIQLPGLVFRELLDVEDDSELFLVMRRNDSSPFVSSLRDIALELGGQRID